MSRYLGEASSISALISLQGQNGTRTMGRKSVGEGIAELEDMLAGNFGCDSLRLGQSEPQGV